MVALIRSAALNGFEKEAVLNSILLTPNRGVWVANDVARVVAEVEAHSSVRRRNSQNYVDNMTFYMTSSEWSRWKANGVQGGETTATEFIQRIQSIGGKNLCEYSKKRAAAIWLCLRGDARSLGVSGRATLREQFSMKWDRQSRRSEPLEYIPELPHPSVFERDHPQMWLRAFPHEEPSPTPEADLNEVLFIDGMLCCRGGKVGFADPQPQLQMQPTMVQPGMNPIDIMNSAMQISSQISRTARLHPPNRNSRSHAKNPLRGP